MRGEPCEVCRYGHICDHSPFGRFVLGLLARLVRAFRAVLGLRGDQ